MQNVVTHSGSFHADDVFAVAAFQLLLGKENLQVSRTRDEGVIAAADYVVDVGNVYDHVAKRYDHHQNGAPVRENGIPYAGFGLMWRHYGEEICGSAEVAEKIEEKLCQPIDAGDNGVTLYELKDLDVQPYELHNLVSLFAPNWDSSDSKDEAFSQAVDWARSVLQRQIQRSESQLVRKKYITSVYENATDKSYLEFDKPIPHTALIDFSDAEKFVCPDDPSSNENWTAMCVRKSHDTFEIRASFPESWAGLRNEELQKVSGIDDAIFCHKARFIFVAGSRESVVRAAKLAT